MHIYLQFLQKVSGMNYCVQKLCSVVLYSYVKDYNEKYKIKHNASLVIFIENSYTLLVHHFVPYIQAKNYGQGCFTLW